MNGFSSKGTGWLAVLVGMMGTLAIVTLLLFFVGLFQNIHSLSFMGGVNDRINALTGFLSALLASVMHPTLQRRAPRLSPVLLVGAWIGAIAITFGSWLIITGRADVELSSYYYLFGNGLIGIWVYVLNRFASQQAAWPRNLTRLGLITSVLMMVGLLNVYGILLGWDGSDFSSLLLGTSISYLGIGILYPIWCLRLGGWIFSKEGGRPLATRE
ncbi:MAG: hypothetical protein M3R47_11970 [Chloroflexota bacterium]|nr:hypothetical protein [Chloroflexota bacterium]